MDIRWTYLLAWWLYYLLGSSYEITISEKKLRKESFWKIKHKKNILRCLYNRKKNVNWVFYHLEMGDTSLKFKTIMKMNNKLQEKCLGKSICNIDNLINPINQNAYRYSLVNSMVKFSCIEVQMDICKACKNDTSPIILSNYFGYLTNMHRCPCPFRIDVQSNQHAMIAYENSKLDKTLCFAYSIPSQYKTLGGLAGAKDVTGQINSANFSCLNFSITPTAYPIGVKIDLQMINPKMGIGKNDVRFIVYYKTSIDQTLPEPVICTNPLKRKKDFNYESVYDGELFKVSCRPPTSGDATYVNCKPNNKWNYDSLPKCILNVNTMHTNDLVKKGWPTPGAAVQRNQNSLTLGIVITLIVLICLAFVSLFVFMVIKFIRIRRSEQPSEPLMNSKVSTTSVTHARFDRNNSVDMRDRPLPLLPLVRTVSEQTADIDVGSLPVHRYYDLDLDPISPNREERDSNEGSDGRENISPVGENVPMNLETVRDAVYSCMTDSMPTPPLPLTLSPDEIKASDLTPDEMSISTESPPTSLKKYRKSSEEKRRSFVGILDFNIEGVEDSIHDNNKLLKGNNISRQLSNESESGYSGNGIVVLNT